jgi:AcrR family transcriptional regulator
MMGRVVGRFPPVAPPAAHLPVGGNQEGADRNLLLLAGLPGQLERQPHPAGVVVVRVGHVILPRQCALYPARVQSAGVIPTMTPAYIKMTGRSSRAWTRNSMRETKKSSERPWDAFKRQGIQEAVATLMSREGIAGLTMEKVASEAGIAKGTLYLYFKSKEELLESVFQASIAPMYARLNAILESHLAPDRKLQTALARQLGYFDEHRPLFRVLVYERDASQARRKRSQSPRYREYVAKLGQTIEAGVRAGILRPVDPLKVAAMLAESNIALIRQRLLDEHPQPAEDDALLLWGVFFQGIAKEQAPEQTASALHGAHSKREENS